MQDIVFSLIGCIYNYHILILFYICRRRQTTQRIYFFLPDPLLLLEPQKNKELARRFFLISKMDTRAKSIQLLLQILQFLDCKLTKVFLMFLKILILL